ncbi:MAG: S9 family peptidase [Gemmatimonadetes bacterium]|nr:S9 family peptidase [Gemmatimonadota bacterium]
MKRFILPALLAMVATPVTAQERVPAETWVDRVLAVRSLVSEVPRWAPDGSKIMFSSSQGGGGIWSVTPEGGAPVRLTGATGGAGHFLQTGQPQWSPDGKWISIISDHAGQPEIWLWSMADGRELRLTGLGSRISSYSWSPDSRWIALTGGRYGSYDVWKVAVPTGESYRLTSDARPEVFPSWTPDSRKILYARLDLRWMDHDLFEISADGANPRLVLSDTDFFDYREGSAFGASLVSPDGKTVLFRSQRSGWVNYWLVPLAGGTPRPMAAEETEQSEAQWSPDGRLIAYVANHNGTTEVRVVPAAGGPSRAVVSPASGMAQNIDWSPDGKRLSYTLQTPTRAADLYVVPVEGGQPKQLTFSDPNGVLEKQLLVPEKVTYRTFDGLVINSYLYKPRNTRPGERLPAIVLTHGGPTGQFSDNFNLHAQFFTEQGYVMLLPNVRGSSGYGRKFEMLNNKDWGHGDLKDVIAGVDYLKTLPYVNPNKMGTEGTSYGGFMSAAAVVWAPEVFQAIIPISGYPDRVKLLDESEYQHIQQLAYEFGPFEQNKDVYYRNSPFYSIKSATAPTFLIWGEGRFPETQQMYVFAKEMERYYKTVKYKAYQGETFYIRTQANTRQMLLDMLDFFDQYLRDKVVTPAAATPVGAR